MNNFTELNLMSNITFKFNEHHLKQILKLLFVIELLLVALYIMNYYFHLFKHQHHMFDLDGEQTIASWFSSCQLLIISFLLLANNFRVPAPNRVSCKFLTIIGLCFMFLSLDESASIHELIHESLKHVNWLPRFKGQQGIWIPIYAVLGFCLVLVTHKNLFEIWLRHKKECTIFAYGFLTLFFGAVVLEVLSYQYLRTLGLENWYILEVALEEAMEMLGGSIMLYAVLLFTLNSNNSER
jgi:hypothetical protein